MTASAQAIFALVGFLWLLPAVYLSRNIYRAWHGEGTWRTGVMARNAFLSWLQFAYAVRWLFWSNAIGHMAQLELVYWSGCAGLSCICAIWFLSDAHHMRKGQ